MMYYFYHKDLLYKEAFQHYHKKNKGNEIPISFEEGVKPGEIVICEKIHGDLFRQNDCLFLSTKNLLNKGEIKKYQNMETFYEKLSSREILQVADHQPEVYVVSNGCGGSGSTTLSLNLAKMLSENHQVFFLSLDILPTYGDLLGEHKLHGLSEIIYKLKTNTPLEWVSENSLDYFNPCDYMEDMMDFTPDIFKALIINLQELKYEKIVVDIGQRYQYLCLENYKSYVIMNTNLSCLDKILALNRLKKTDGVLINQKEDDEIIQSHHLDSLDLHEFVSKDFNLRRGGLNWASKEIQATWQKLLKLK